MRVEGSGIYLLVEVRGWHGRAVPKKFFPFTFLVFFFFNYPMCIRQHLSAGGEPAGSGVPEVHDVDLSKVPSFDNTRSI